MLTHCERFGQEIGVMVKTKQSRGEGIKISKTCTVFTRKYLCCLFYCFIKVLCCTYWTLSPFECMFFSHNEWEFPVHESAVGLCSRGWEHWLILLPDCTTCCWKLDLKAIMNNSLWTFPFLPKELKGGSEYVNTWRQIKMPLVQPWRFYPHRAQQMKNDEKTRIVPKKSAIHSAMCPDLDTL